MVQQPKPTPKDTRVGDLNGHELVEWDRKYRENRRVLQRLRDDVAHATDRRCATEALQRLDDALEHNGDALLNGEARSVMMRDETLKKSYGAVRGINRHALALAELKVSSPGVMADFLTK